MAWGLAAVLAAALLGGSSFFQRGDWMNPRLVRYLIPAGYVGWVHVHYGVPNAPTFPLEDGRQLIRVPANGIVQTSSKQEFSWEKDEYYYLSGTHRQLLKETTSGEGGMIWGGITSSAGTPDSDDPASGKGPWSTSYGFFVGTKVQFAEYWFLRSQPSRLEKEFYAFGRSCGSEDGSRGFDEFAENPNAPRRAMVGAGKTQVYPAKLAGGIPGTEATRRERTTNHKMAEAYKLHNLLVAAGPNRQGQDLQAFKTGYGIAQLIIRIKLHTEVESR